MLQQLLGGSVGSHLQHPAAAAAAWPGLRLDQADSEGLYITNIRRAFLICYHPSASNTPQMLVASFSVHFTSLSSPSAEVHLASTDLLNMHLALVGKRFDQFCYQMSVQLLPLWRQPHKNSSMFGHT